jgi:hypothetical protein
MLTKHDYRKIEAMGTFLGKGCYISPAVANEAMQHLTKDGI